MENQKNTTLWIIMLVLIASGVGYYIFNDLKSVKVNTEVTENTETIEDVEEVGENEIVDDTAIAEIEIDDGLVSGVPLPDLNREIVFPEGLSQSVKDRVTKSITDAANALLAGNDSYSSSINLGLNRKIIGDYEGARQAWEYTNSAYPENSISYVNLGDLYGYYLKDTENAEKNFLKAIENNPGNVSVYFKTAEFYRDAMKDIEKARQIVQRGIDANPSSEELKSLLNTF